MFVVLNPLDHLFQLLLGFLTVQQIMDLSEMPTKFLLLLHEMDIVLLLGQFQR